jgi:raffinose/stachyose/melibiose transport system permease protein
MSSFAEGAELAPAATLPEAEVAATEELTPKEKPKGGIGMTIIIALVALLWISPLVLLVITAFRPLSDFVANGPLAWPQEWTLQNFADAWGLETLPRPTATVHFC